ncbi:MAG: DUF3021 family protein [Lachnospiraceae bacterium]|nr:DUF3021 family protein [Lachnospiraceae bacterium]
MLKEFFISLVHYFVDITTAVIIVAAAYLSISGKPVENEILWEVLLAGLLTALPSAILLTFDPKSVKLSLALWVVHFLLIYGVTLLLLNMFGWATINAQTFILTFIAVVFIYVFVCIFHYLLSKKHTTVLNQQLKRRYAKMESNEDSAK